MTNVVTTSFRAITGQFNANVRGATTTLNKYGKAAQLTAGRTVALNNAMRGTAISANKLSNAIGLIGLGKGVALLAIGRALTQFAASAITAAAAFEDLQVRFNTFTGNAVQTELLFDNISKTALRTGNSIETLREVQTRLQFLVTQGTTTQTELNTILEKYANLAALSGTSTLDLALSMRGFAQAAASPIIQMQEIRQIAEAIPSLFAGLSKALDLSGESLRDFVAEGNLTQSLFLRIFPKALAFAANSAEANADRISASWRNVENQATLAFERIGTEFRDVVVEFNNTSADLVEESGKSFLTLTKGIKAAIENAAPGESIEVVKEDENGKIVRTTESLNKFQIALFSTFGLYEDLVRFFITTPSIVLAEGIERAANVSGLSKLFVSQSQSNEAIIQTKKYKDELKSLELQLRGLSAAAADVAAFEINQAINGQSDPNIQKIGDFDPKLFGDERLKALLVELTKRRDALKQFNREIITLETERSTKEDEIIKNRTEVFTKEYGKTLRALKATISKSLSAQQSALRQNQADQEKTTQEILRLKERQASSEIASQTEIGNLERSLLSNRRRRFETELALSSASSKAALASFDVQKAKTGEERKLANERFKAFAQQAIALADETESVRAQISTRKDIARLEKRVSDSNISALEEEQKARKTKEADILADIAKLKIDLEVANKSLKKLTEEKVDAKLDLGLKEIINQLNEAIKLKNELLRNPSQNTPRLPSTQSGGAFATGGTVPGSGRGDRVRAMLEPREFVLRRSAALSLGPGVLNTLNRGGMRGLQRLIAKGIGSKSGNIHVPTLPAGVIQGRQSGGFVNPTGNEQRIILDVRLPNGRGESIPTTKDGAEAIARLFAESVNL